MQFSEVGSLSISRDLLPAFPCDTLFLRPTGLIINPLTPILFPSIPVTVPKMILVKSPSGFEVKI